MVTVGPIAIDVQHLLCAGNSWCWVSDLGWLLFVLLVSWSCLILQKQGKVLNNCYILPCTRGSFPFLRLHIYCFQKSIIHIKQTQMCFWLTKYQLKRNNGNKQEYRFPTNLRIFIYLCSTSQPCCFSKEKMHPLTLKSSVSCKTQLCPEIHGKGQKKAITFWVTLPSQRIISFSITRIQNAPSTSFDVSASEMTEGIEEWNKTAFPVFAEGWVSVHPQRAKWQGCLYKRDMKAFVISV